MAGRKQHYIPQSVLRGFEASRTAKKSQVVVYKRGCEPFKTSTEGVAAQRDFYSAPRAGAADTLDEFITQFEIEQFNPILANLRERAPGDVNARGAATAVVHLGIRGAHLRGAFARFAQRVLLQLDDMARDPQALRRFVGVDAPGLDSRLAQEVALEFEKAPYTLLSPEVREVLAPVIRYRVREGFDEWVPAALPEMRWALDQHLSLMPSTIENAHIRALRKSLVPQSRLAELERLQWMVVEIEAPQHFVLPDCVAIAGTSFELSELRPYATGFDEPICLVVMPIGADRVLIGSVGTFTAEAEDLNRAFVRCSLDFFVASRKDASTDALAPLVGESMVEMERTLVDAELSEADLLPTQHVVLSPAQMPSEVTIRTPQGMSVNSRSIEMLKSLVVQQCRSGEAGLLEAIDVVADVAAAVAGLRMRDLTEKERQEVFLGTLEATGTPQAPRFQLLLPVELLRHLNGLEATFERMMAIYIVKHNLGRLTYLAYWTKAYAHVAPTSLRLAVGAEFVMRFASHYFGARLGAPEAPIKALQATADGLGVMIANIFPVMQRLLDQYRADQLLHALEVEMYAAVDMLLTSAVSACGLYASRNASLPVDSVAGRVLKQYGLWDWLRLLEMDLRRHFDSRGHWASTDEVLTLSTHVERLLWHFAIFWRDGPGHVLMIDVGDDQLLRTIRKVLATVPVESAQYEDAPRSLS